MPSGKKEKAPQDGYSQAQKASAQGQTQEEIGFSCTSKESKEESQTNGFGGSFFLHCNNPITSVSYR